MAHLCDETTSDSELSSDLSSVGSRTPSPGPELAVRTTHPPVSSREAYPSPPSSHDSSHSGSPSPDDSSAMNSDKDGPPPRKKRRVSERPPRTTEYLDLRYGSISPEERPQLDRLLNVLHKRQKIVVIAGAGISVSAGIPDFRSSTGLFTSLRAQHNLKGGSGKDLFDASVVYKDASSTSSFHDMVRSMSKETRAAQPTPFHHMLATLSQQDRLLRLYSQNVDGIDTSLQPLATKIPLAKDESGKWPRTVQLHGGLTKMVCSKCHDVRDFKPDLFDGPVPPICSECEEIDRLRTQELGRRSHGVGMLRPRMVLYNEHNPDDEAIGSVTRDDLRKRPDAVIVVGTTLKVPGVKRIVREMCATVRDRRDGVAIWVNNDPEPSGKEFEDCWDIVVRGKCDEVAKLAALGQWDRQNDSREVTMQSVERASQEHVKIMLDSRNPTFKRPERDGTPMGSPERPLMTPLTASRRTSVMPTEIKDSFDSDAPAETPSRRKSRANSKPIKAATSKAAQKDLTAMFTKDKKTAATATKKTRPKKATTNPRTSKAATANKATAKSTVKSQQNAITFKTTKVASIVAKTGKGGNKVKDDPNLRSVPPEDSRNNSSHPSLFPTPCIKSTIGDSEDDRIIVAPKSVAT